MCNENNVIRHPGGAVEINTNNGILVFTNDEYQRARKWGRSIARHRQLRRAATDEKDQ